MAKSDYLDPNDDAFSAQLITFKTNIGGYATLLDLSAADVSAQAADAVYFAYDLACLKVMQNAAQQWTAWKNLVRDGGTPPATGMPVVPVLPAAVPPVALGIEARFRALVKRIKVHKNYNPSIGEALAIEGAVQTGADLTTIQPDIDASISGGSVKIGWDWQGQSAFLDQCEIEVDRADGKGFVMLTFDTTPGYTDTTPFPATPTKWTYRAIYRVADARVGQWSKSVSVMVG